MSGSLSNAACCSAYALAVDRGDRGVHHAGVSEFWNFALPPYEL
jgi:hypothetical protein